MTWSERIKVVTEIVSAVAKFLSAAWSWVVLALLVFTALLLLHQCGRADRAEDEVERVKEAAALELADFIVARRAEKADLEKQVKEVPALQEEIDRLTEQLGRKPKVVTVERIVTVPAAAEGAPRPAPAPGAPCPDCLFAVGDTGQIRVDSAHVETSKGNEVVALAAECWRLTPEPATRILVGTASAPLSRVTVEAPPSKRGWSAGLAGGIATTGPVGSVLVVSPPLWRLEGVGVVSAGPGLFSAQVGIVYRP